MMSQPAGSASWGAVYNLVDGRARIVDSVGLNLTQ